MKKKKAFPEQTGDGKDMNVRKRENYYLFLLIKRHKNSNFNHRNYKTKQG